MLYFLFITFVSEVNNVLQATGFAYFFSQTTSRTNEIAIEETR